MAVSLAIADPPPTTRPLAAEPVVDEWIATLPSGATVELVGVSNHPLDAGGWWMPDGSTLLSPPENLMTAQMYRGSRRPIDWPWKADAKLYKFFVRYETPDNQQRVMSPRVEGDQARGAHRGIGKEHFFLECVMPMPADAKSGTIRIDLGMDGIETLIDAEDITTAAEVVVPHTKDEKIIFHPETDAQGQYSVTIDCPTDLINNDFVRPVATVQGKDVTQFSTKPREHPVDGITRIRYVMDAKTADVQRFRFEAFRPREYARFGNVCLDPATKTVPTVDGRKGDRWPPGIKAR